MSLSELNAISPIDGRYKSKTTKLDNFFSEYALFKYRVRVEVEYFIALCQMPLPQLSAVKPTVFDSLRDIYRNFSEEDAKYIKGIERTTNHDVKAVEYFLKERCEDLGLSDHLEFIHFGLTSQDINNTAIPLSTKEAIDEVIMPELNAFRKELLALCSEWKDIPMLAKTHGQPASPTRLGKEFYVFVERIEEQINLLIQIPVAAKFGGATGNFNAHVVAYPDVDWVDFGNNFLNDYLELDRTQTTTQIEHYDHFAATADVFKRINNIMIDFSRDVWTYISMEYFKQKLKEGEVGSSAMPHKVNPIDFENAEGNLGIANALFEHFAAKLPISRLQRDLTDSTVLRNVGVPFGHMMIALASLRKGIGKLLLNEEKINEDLEKNWAVVAEAIQTILRREGYPKPYEALKALTRGKSAINKDAIHSFIKELNVSESVKKEMLAITPQNYVGLSPKL
jgi:adenylosuccinate lyase